MADEDGLLGLAGEEGEGNEDQTPPSSDHPAHTSGLSANPADTAEDPPPEEEETPPGDEEPGERPEHIPEQFWDAEKGEINTEDLAKSYGELRTAFNKLQNEKGGEVPESADEYVDGFELQREMGEGDDRSVLENVKDFEENDPALLAAAEAAKAAGLTKEQFGDFTHKFLHAIDAEIEPPLDMDAEMEKLGGKEKATVMATAGQNWLNSLAASGTLNEEQAEFAKNFAKSAAGLSTLNVLRGLAGEQPIPGNVLVGSSTKSEAEVQAMMSDERYHADGPVGDAYRADVEAEVAKLNEMKRAASG